MMFCQALTFFWAVYFVSAQDVELALAKKNIEGYPASLLFEVISSIQDGDSKLEKARMADLLETKEVQAAVTRSALEYSAKELNRSGQARYLFSDPGMCEFSWVSWLPWMGCETPETKMSSTSLPLIIESSYSCY